MGRFLPLVVVLCVLAAVPAHAQEKPRQSVAAGMRWAYPVSYPVREGTPGVDVSYRGWLTRYAALEANLGRWTFGTTFSRDPIRTFTEEVTGYSFGASVIGQVPVGRASFLVGGGPGYFWDVETNRVLIGNEFHSHTATRGAFGAQAVLEVDIRVTERLSVFAGVRGELRDITYTDSAVAYPTAGVRFAF